MQKLFVANQRFAWEKFYVRFNVKLTVYMYMCIYIYIYGAL